MHPTEQRLRELILQHGPITFARFMELALFSPEGGYYTTPRHLDARGDYFTSPAAHPLFGVLLGIQLQQMWELLEKPNPFTVVELGAGSGLLGRELVRPRPFLDPDFSSALRYIAVERFAPPVLASAEPAWRGLQPLVAQGIPLQGVEGCILSNELLDSFPVHRFEVRHGRIQELFVTLQDGRFAELLAEPSTPEIAQRVQGAARRSLPEGFRGEVCLALEPWMAEAARALRRGFVLTVDYGDTAEGLYRPQRSRGTLQCYYQHTLSANPYVRVARQDITAHVDFSFLMDAGQRHGLATLGYTTQRELLTNLGAQAFLQALDRVARSPSHQRMSQGIYLANRMPMQELLRPEGLGGFCVLAQGRGVEPTPLWGFQSHNPWLRTLLEQTAALEVPLLTAEHTPLLEGRYPHQAFDPEPLTP